jgi:hypothetical protein
LTVVLPFDPAAPVLRERPERKPRVAHDDQRQGLGGDAADALHHRRRGPALAGRTHIVVAVEALAPQRDEQGAGRGRPAVGRH